MYGSLCVRWRTIFSPVKVKVVRERCCVRRASSFFCSGRDGWCRLSCFVVNAKEADGPTSMMEDTIGIGYRADPQDGTLPASAASFVRGQTQGTCTKQEEDEDHGDKSLIEEQKRHTDSAANTVESSQQITLMQERVEQGRLRAQAILRRFQEQQETLLQLPSAPAPTPQLVLDSLNNEHQQQLPSVYVEQRRKAAIREKRRLQQAWSKNFAYLAAKQDAERHAWEEKILAAQQREAQAEQHYQSILQERVQKKKQQLQQKELQSQAGIGTHQRKRAQATQAKLRQPPSVALYLSGIPRDGSIDTHTLSDIFRAYGKVTKVHFYRDKTTGHLKGDGLVVFQVPDLQEGGTLLQTVCAQVGIAVS